ncbi:S-adenosyl-L-methionine-dependent methyltransferase [Biscogniauxia mediterranea]|nr:S-adenosyl-L-methionine-dependent methyltransferase [Biscogniauxia mediterranea]
MASREQLKAEEPISDSESSDSRDDEGWNDVEEDEEEVQEVISLLDDRVFPDVMSMLMHCKEKHSFDFLGVRQRLQLDFHGCVKLVNFIRQRVHEGLPVSEDISVADIDHEQYLKPVLDDDAVILGLFDLPELTPAGAVPPQGDNATLVNDLLKRNTELQEELASVTAQFERYRATVSQTLDERWGDVDQEDAESSGKAGKGKDAAQKGVKEDESQYYWDSYAGNEIHETMLKDTVRTDAYRDFIYNNKHLFAGKTVLDIGCGTGILSMFCARAGASRVIAVDASAIIGKARENVYHNGLSSTITCLHGRIEEVTLPVDKVDVIVSEWMGYCLLFEAMLPSVLWARDRYLRPDTGIMVPSHTNLWAAPVADPDWVADNVAFWHDVYGFDMHRAMARGICDETRVLHWPRDRLAGAPCAFRMLDLYAVSAADLSFTAPFATTLDRDIDALDGFLVWFDTFFSPTRPSPGDPNVPADDAVADAWAAAGKNQNQNQDQDRVAFTTGPAGKETHWKQGLLLCDHQKQLEKEEKGGSSTAALKRKKGDRVAGEITFSVPEDMPRGLAIEMSWDEGEGRKSQKWSLR